MADFASHTLGNAFGDSDVSRSHMTDPAFEPHSTFAFEDCGNHFREGHHHLHLTSLDAFDHNERRHHGSIDVGAFSDGGMSDNYARASSQGVVHMYPFGPEPLATDELWMADRSSLSLSPTSLEAASGSKQSAGVPPTFEQITPPDDDYPGGSLLGAAPQLAAFPHSAQLPFASSRASAKSERARNAANQRHAKAKKSRQDSGTDVPSPESDVVDSSEGKREKYREKNRLAAAKCRAKKKTNVEDLEERAREATARNSQLKLHARELRNAFSELRSRALMHDTSQGCQCQQIHMYNANKAQEAARGAITLPVFMNASMHSEDHVNPTPLENSGRFAVIQSRSIAKSAQRKPQHSASQVLCDSTTSQYGLPTENDLQQDRAAYSDVSFDEA